MRAAYAGGGPTLQTYVSRALQNLPVLGDREVAHPSHGTLRINQETSDRNGAFIHLVAKVAGEQASTVGEGRRLVRDAELPVAPPVGRSFKNADLFALIRANHLVICTDGIRYQVLEYYLKNLFEKAQLNNRAAQFEIEKIANVDAVAKLQRGGVNEIQIDGTLYSATVNHLRRAQPIGANRSLANVARTLADQLAAVFGKDQDEEFAERSENLLVKLTIKADGGSRSEEVVLNKLENIGIDLLDELGNDFTYTIKTNDHKVIRSDEVLVSKPVILERLEEQNSLSYVEVWEALAGAMNEFERNGDLEV
ncbi:MAG TPA: hypothetical protein VM576_00050 [Xanthomonadaceae bacterium]|nr:hypothetical protein [Xanthomonadaceae bacterium]